MMAKFFMVMAIFIFSFSFAHQVDRSAYNEILDKIEANKNICVDGVSEDRIYLKPDRLFPTEQGIYLNLNDIDYVHLPILNSDSNGCYVPCVRIFNICPGCGREYFISCSTPDCPLKQKRQDYEREKERKKEEYKKGKKKK